LRLEQGIRRGPSFEITIDGESVMAYPGETIATVLLCAGKRRFRATAESGEPRGLYCGMGICFDCLVTLDGRPNVRACVTLAEAGVQVERQSV
jgi:aerobic-type carbon monoxide dehydrogenase small subunit (CoxS/CutS family)